jgi:hypothetical protein
VGPPARGPATCLRSRLEYVTFAAYRDVHRPHMSPVASRQASDDDQMTLSDFNHSSLEPRASPPLPLPRLQTLGQQVSPPLRLGGLAAWIEQTREEQGERIYQMHGRVKQVDTHCGINHGLEPGGAHRRGRAGSGGASQPSTSRGGSVDEEEGDGRSWQDGYGGASYTPSARYR